MQEIGNADRAERQHEQHEQHEGSGSGGSEPGRGVRAVAYVAAAALALGAGFGLTRLIHPPRAASPSSAIPAPARSGGVFTEDDDGTGQDSQTNIFQSTVPGLVHVMSGGQAVGIGLVLTPSGKLLTTYQPSGGSGPLRAKYLRSGKTFTATVLGTDPAAAWRCSSWRAATARLSRPWRSATPTPSSATRTRPGNSRITSPARSSWA